MTPEPELESELTPARRREDLSLPVGSSAGACGGAGGGSPASAAAGAGAGVLSPAGDLWWDNTEGSVGDQLDDVELLQDMELDEVSLGILTPDQMEDDSHLLLPPDELSRSLELLASPDPETAAAAADRTFSVAPPPERVRLTSDEGAPLNVTVTIDREPDWEDEFDAPAASALPQTQVRPEREPVPATESAAAAEPEPATAAIAPPAAEPMKPVEPVEPVEGMEPVEPAKPSAHHCVASDTGVSDTSQGDSDAAVAASESNGESLPAGDVTASMSSESSDVTLKDESSGAGEALAEPPSPDTETLVLARPQTATVADAGAAPLVTGPLVTESSAGAAVVKVCVVSDHVQCDSGEQKPQEQRELHETKPAAAMSPGPERKKVSCPYGPRLRRGGGGRVVCGARPESPSHYTCLAAGVAAVQ